jgi:hypothetical protein
MFILNLLRDRRSLMHTFTSQSEYFTALTRKGDGAVKVNLHPHSVDSSFDQHLNLFLGKTWNLVAEPLWGAVERKIRGLILALTF